MEELLVLCIFTVLAFVTSANPDNEDWQDPSSLFFNHDNVKPVIYSAGTGVMDAYSNSVYDNDVLVKMRAFENDFEVNLHSNKDILSENYTEIYEENGQFIIQKPLMKETESCHYQGTLNGYEGSWAALSICDGVSGVFSDGKELYYVQPDLTDDGHSHFVFRGSDMIPQNSTCGTETSGNSSSFDYKTKGAGNDIKPSAQRQQYYEILIVNDYAEYAYRNNRDFNRVVERNKQIINVVDAIFSASHLKIKLTAIVGWNGGDQIPISSDAGTLLRTFAAYRKDNYVGVLPNDAAVLLTYKGTGGVTGIAYVPSVCNDYWGGLIVVDHNNVVGLVAQTMAHELGHTLGMGHDDNSCSCNAGRCVMDPYSGDFYSWSSCSQRVFNSLEGDSSKNCLNNRPGASFN